MIFRGFNLIFFSSSFISFKRRHTPLSNSEKRDRLLISKEVLTSKFYQRNAILPIDPVLPINILIATVFLFTQGRMAEGDGRPLFRDLTPCRPKGFPFGTTLRSIFG